MSVDSIKPPITNTCTRRCSLLITIVRIERRVGKMIKCAHHETHFESDTGGSVCLIGFHEASFDGAKEATIRASLWRWTEDTSIVTTGDRFGGQGPSSISAKEYLWLGNMLKSIKTLRSVLNLDNIFSDAESRMTMYCTVLSYRV